MSEGEWINVGIFTDFISGKLQLIFYTNTEEMVWHIGVIS